MSADLDFVDYKHVSTLSTGFTSILLISVSPADTSEEANLYFITAHCPGSMYFEALLD